MKIVAYDVYHDDAFATEMGYQYLSLEDLFAKSDVITIHAPYLPSTHHLINASNVGLIKKRRDPREHRARRDCGNAGAHRRAQERYARRRGHRRAGGRGSHEDRGYGHRRGTYRHAERHHHAANAFNTREAFLRILDTTIDNIVAFVNGAPTNVVKPPAPPLAIPVA